jgi:dephospho-CoA kinase
MLRIGLTGGIGSGKSAVVAMLRDLGVPVIEADDVSREVVRQGEPAWREIVETFSREILQENGEIDRVKLAALVFADPEKLARLNRIVHPRVLAALDRWLADRKREAAPIAVVEAPLLFESGYAGKLDRVVVVFCRREQQFERLIARGMSPEDAESRIAAQMPPEEKQRLAADRIDNSGSLEETRRQVALLVEKWKRLPQPGEAPESRASRKV